MESPNEAGFEGVGGKEIVIVGRMVGVAVGVFVDLRVGVDVGALASAVGVVICNVGNSVS